MTTRTRAAEAESEDVPEAGDRSEDRQPEVVDVDGEQVSLQDLIHTHRERSSWQASLKQQQQTLAEIAKGATAAAEAARNAPRREVEPERPAPRAEVVDLSSEIDALTASLPDPGEKPEEFKAGFNAGLKKLFPKYRQSVVDEVTANLRQEQEVNSQRLREETGRTVQGNAETQQIVSQNVRLLDETLAEQFPGHTAAQRALVAEELKALSGAKYGEVFRCADGNSVIRYNRAAVLQAAKMADLKPSTGRARPNSPSRTEEPEELGPPPAPTATAKAHIDWLIKAKAQGGEAVEGALREHFEGLPDKKRREILKEYTGG